ncbi:MAG: MerR family transcriptional regulator [Deltaproteobacteria bacterium]|nr:MerR family transcriptional regulator [Deltaproteobacteria bacterium]
MNPTPPTEPKPKNHEATAVLIPDKQYFKIGEVSSLTGLEPYVLRYWETEFKSIRPVRMGSNQRLYRRRDVEIILEIKHLLYKEGFTIAGAKKRVIHHNHHKAEKERLAEQEPLNAALPETSPEAGPLRDLLKSVQHELLELKQLLSR